MKKIETLITGSQKLTDIYGCWPSFHDAEVIELHFSRGNIRSGEWSDSDVYPFLTAKIHIFIEDPSSHHTLATLRFEAVEDFSMEGFNHQNSILGLVISIEERGEGLLPYLCVKFEPAFGMSATFRCLCIEVVEAVRCRDDGTVGDQ